MRPKLSGQRRKIIKTNRFVCRRRTVCVQDSLGNTVYGYVRWTIWDRQDKIWLDAGPQREMQFKAKEMSECYRLTGIVA